jgi:hypothetical protein
LGSSNNKIKINSKIKINNNSNNNIKIKIKDPTFNSHRTRIERWGTHCFHPLFVPAVCTRRLHPPSAYKSSVQNRQAGTSIP